MPRNKYGTDVFINCPFDAQYRPLFEAIVFAVLDCNFRPRCSLEIDDASEVRIDRIFKIIAACRFAIHDISRTEVTGASGLPRFNMPLELGMFMAAKRFGAGKHKQKESLASKEAFLACSRLVEDLDGFRPVVLLGIAKHIQGDPIVDMLLGADAIHRLLHLAVTTIAPLHGVGS
jgi:hypothetical protein